MINSINIMELDHLVRTMVEFRSKIIVDFESSGWLVVSPGSKGGETGKGGGVAGEDSESKLNRRITDLEADYDELKEKYEGAEVELDDLKGCIIQEHINGFQKGLSQAAFFYQDVDAADTRFDVNKDVVDGQLVNKAESSLEEEVEKETTEGEKDAEAAMEGDDNKATSESRESERSVGRHVEEESTSPMAVVDRIPMETVTEVREDPPEEIAESNWPAKVGYEWIAANVRNQSSLFRWSRLLNSWLNCTPVIAKGVDCGIVSLEQVSAIERVCHSQEGATDKFFYMYMCHFSQLHVRLPLDDFTMGVLRELNVAPTQLHPNSWAYLQAFHVLCQSLYLRPSPLAFLYFYDTRPCQPTTWLSLVSRPSISRLDAFSQSFKHFKDGYFNVVTGSPSRYKDMGTDELSAADKDVVEVLMKFSDTVPTKGLVRVYNLVHPIIDIEEHMAQSGKKNLALFQALRKEMAAKAKTAGNTEVPNLQESLVEVHVHGGTKRKAELSARPGKGKDVKKVRAALLGSGSSSGAKGPEADLIELRETSVRKDIDINLLETMINSINIMELDHLVRTMVEFRSKIIVDFESSGWLVVSPGSKGGETGKGGGVAGEDSESKLNRRITDLEADYDELKEKYEGAEVELDDLKGCIIQEHINGFQKGLSQAAFFYQDVDAADTRFDVNKDVVDGQLVNKAESSLEEEVEKETTEGEKDAEAAMEGDDNKAT
ncbi:hypothetical protein DEO72_LG1g2567 [Vigna unguiculata]|uniref:Transposase (putative) gypsy type domain-containing protein n=1 Tax=Vigna unguiculata TaxID=3917 RepID=A0A4D6KWR4_VIGUN|nr:hypothetical protein DEO72_LG1g2567 [Vigna unguiculata]